MHFRSNFKFGKNDVGQCRQGYLNLSLENEHDDIFTVLIIGFDFQRTCKENCSLDMAIMGECRWITVIVESAGFSNMSYSFSMQFTRKYYDNNIYLSNTALIIICAISFVIFLIAIALCWFYIFKHKVCCYRGADYDILFGKCFCITNRFRFCQGHRGDYSPMDQ